MLNERSGNRGKAAYVLTFAWEMENEFVKFLKAPKQNTHDRVSGTGGGKTFGRVNEETFPNRVWQKGGLRLAGSCQRKPRNNVMRDAVDCARIRRKSKFVRTGVNYELAKYV